MVKINNGSYKYNNVDAFDIVCGFMHTTFSVKVFERKESNICAMQWCLVLESVVHTSLSYTLL
jgi:hypothetical protein